FERRRMKAKLAVRSSKTGLKIGLFKKHTHEVLSIPNCLVHHPAINEVVALIRQEVRAQGILPYEENSGSGLLRYLQLFVDRNTRKVQLTLIVNAKKTTTQLKVFCQELLKSDLWHSLWLNFHPAKSNRVLGEVWQHIAGE